MKKIILLLVSCCALHALAQFTPGALAPDFSVADINGNELNLYSKLDSGKTVILHCFAAWDSYAWEYYQQQTLDAFEALYGSEGSGSVVVWRVECETQNTLSQLQGPPSANGNVGTDTQGDWLTGSSLPIVDDSTFAAQLAMPYVPVLVIICPDRIVRFADQLSLGNLTNLVFQTSCPPLTTGYDPALINATSSRSCGSNSLDVQLVLKNLGTDTLFNATIAVNGATPGQTISWEGQLNSYRSDTIAITGLEVLSDAAIQFAISNSNIDVSNDSLSVRADVGFSTQLVKLELALDAYPEEVSWEIRNELDTVVYNGGGYEVDYQYINNVFQLPASGCYYFFLRDTRGDGLHGSQYGGFDGFCKLYSMTDSTTVEEEMFFYDGTYNFSNIDNSPSFLQYSFEAGSSLPVNELSTPNWSVYPNPVEHMLILETPAIEAAFRGGLYDLAGRCCKQIQGRTGESRCVIDVSELSGGMYMLIIEKEKQITRMPILVAH
ncbi:MAG: T9SS type A sorting domain-containing protein [Flavobacteriales bacterium]